MAETFVQTSSLISILVAIGFLFLISAFIDFNYFKESQEILGLFYLLSIGMGLIGLIMIAKAMRANLVKNWDFGATGIVAILTSLNYWLAPSLPQIKVMTILLVGLLLLWEIGNCVIFTRLETKKSHARQEEIVLEAT